MRFLGGVVLSFEAYDGVLGLGGSAFRELDCLVCFAYFWVAFGLVLSCTLTVINLISDVETIIYHNLEARLPRGVSSCLEVSKVWLERG